VPRGIEAQDRARGDSPWKHWIKRDPHATRQKRIEVMRAEIGSPKAQRAIARRDSRLREIRRSV
jgi:hypothetical protein